MARTLKYIQARVGLLNFIAQEGVKVGDKLPSEKELVDKFSVSSISVRRAMADLARDGVIEKVQGLGSFLLKPIRSIPFDGVVVLIEIQRKRSYSLLPGLAELQSRLEDLRFQLRYSPCHQLPSEQVLREVENAAGVMVTGRMDEDWADFLDLLHVPVVVIGSNPFPDRFPTATYDWHAAGRMLVDHFVQTGCRRIGLINGTTDYFPARMIHDGYQQALQAHGLPYESDDVIWPAFPHLYEQVEAFLRIDRFDALVVEPGAVLTLLNWHWNHQPRHSPIMGVAGWTDGLAMIDNWPRRMLKSRFQESVFTHAVKLFCDVLRHGRKARSITFKPVLELT